MSKRNYTELLETLKNNLSSERGGSSFVHYATHPVFSYILELIKKDYYLVKKKNHKI